MHAVVVGECLLYLCVSSRFHCRADGERRGRESACAEVAQGMCRIVYPHIVN